VLASLSVVVVCGVALVGGAAAQANGTVAPHKLGTLDCNLLSKIQTPVKIDNACTDIRALPGVDNEYSWGGHFYDNGRYIGHDEPDLRFISPTAGSGDNVFWTETLGKDPTAAPTVATPGSDVNHWVELTPAPWFSMALCDQFSYPQTSCTPNSDKNAPAPAFEQRGAPNTYVGGGSSFLEAQFYPPGEAPFPDNISCDNTHWCASLHINDLECTASGACNGGCIEPTNFAFVQKDGVPTGPPAPQDSTVASFTPNSKTLLMNPGDTLKIHIWDAPIPGTSSPVQHALELFIRDVTTGQTGFMQASKQNGFMATNIVDCSGIPFSYQPEFSSAKPGNVNSWAALQTNVSTEFEIGHFEACKSLSQPFEIPGFTDIAYNKCAGPYETAGGSEGTEPGDGLCYPAGDTHFGQAFNSIGSSAPGPNVVTGCEDNWFQNGDLDFNGNPYWPDWPNGSSSNFPTTFLQSPPHFGAVPSSSNKYGAWQIQSDVELSESTCAFPTTTGCTVPPAGPGHFYPYWTLTKSCQWEFGNMTNGNDFGQDSQYGAIPSGTGYAETFGPITANSCP
jgi:hypothetical protein